MIKMTRKRWLLVFGLALLGVAIFLVNPIEESPRRGLDHDFAIESPEFLPSMAGATSTPFTPGNRVDILNNGDQFYPAMLEAVGQVGRTMSTTATSPRNGRRFLRTTWLPAAASLSRSGAAAGR